MQTFYYGGQLLYQKSWTEGMSGGGMLNFACVDLYGNSASFVYYDDFSLVPWQPTPTQPTTWGQIKAAYRTK